MAENAENQKVFHHYSNFSTKVRMLVVNEMPISDRGRFLQCSKACNKEVKYSKKFINSLAFAYFSKNDILITVNFEKQGNGYSGYFLHFRCVEGQNKLFYECITKSWEVELGASSNLLKDALLKFKSLLLDYHDVVRWVVFNDRENGVENVLFSQFNFGIESWESLEELTIRGGFSAIPVLSKLRRPLKYLCIEGTDDQEDHDQIYRVQTELIWCTPHLENYEFSHISAKKVYVNIGKLTEFDIFKFIRSWQDGTIGKDIVCYRWSLRGSNFHVQKLLRLLREDHDFNDGGLEIKHFEEPGKSAILFYNGYQLKFEPNFEQS